jgi:hypothetical protein
MTTSDVSPGETSYGPSGTGSGAKDKAKQAAGTAADEGKQLAGNAKDEARQVAEDAKQQARNLMDEARSQVDEQSRVQRDRLVSTMRTFGDDLQKMADGEGASQGLAQDLTRQIATRVREMTSTMDGREPADLVEQVRSFARRRPGTFLLGALAAGVVAGRLTRGAKAASDQPSSSLNSSPGSAALPAPGVGTQPPGTAAGEPLYGTGYPSSPPVYPAGSGETYTGSAGVSGTTAGAPGDPLNPAVTPAAPQATPPSGDPLLDDGDRRGSA